MINPVAIVIVGASGDLARGKLIPALSSLFESGHLGEDSLVVGTGRTFFDTATFRDRFRCSPRLRDRLYYHAGFAGLKNFIAGKGTFSRVIFFLAVPPSAYSSAAAAIAAEDFGTEACLIIEKPFGYDHASARQLNADLSACFAEEQIFRIDHYLAKETVRNILVFRFANRLFEPIWNSCHIESIQINALESAGLNGRGGRYFDKAGILRDMVQNHLLQLLCLLTMESPASLDWKEVSRQKRAVLQSLSFTGVRCGQYRGYREEEDVDPRSTTETYAEVDLRINAERWRETSVHFRTGKALNRKGTEIGIRFRRMPQGPFSVAGNLAPNIIVFRIHPAEGIILSLASKMPGGDMQVVNQNMAFCNPNPEGRLLEAYEKLILDVMQGDRTLFVSAEETELAWEKIGPILDGNDTISYDRGSAPPPMLGVDWIDFEKYSPSYGLRSLRSER